MPRIRYVILQDFSPYQLVFVMHARLPNVLCNRPLVLEAKFLQLVSEVCTKEEEHFLRCESSEELSCVLCHKMRSSKDVIFCSR